MSSQVGNGASLGGGLGGVRESRLRTQRERLAGLKDSMQQVAAKLRSEGGAARRTALAVRFNDLQRKVNELDGIVAGEGQEAQAQGQVAAASARPQGAGGTASRGPAGPAQTPATQTPATQTPATQTAATQTAAAAGTTAQGDQVDVVV